jgi:hypothetical protein
MLPESDTTIWGRLLDPSRLHLTTEAAEGILSIRFSDAERSRVRELAQKSNDGALSEAERAEYESYVRVEHALALLHLKARRALQHKG